MRVFKTALATLLLLLAGAVSAPSASAQSQGQFTPHFVYASDYGAWNIASQQANTFTFFPISICTVPSPLAGTFFPFNTNAPVLIADATPANSEVLTPSSIVQTSSQCGVVISPSNQHYSFHITSGTGGLQEALNAVAVPTAQYPALIYLDRNWYQLISASAAISGNTPATTIGAVKGGVSALLADLTTATPTYYVWNGTAYASGTWVNTAPTLAAGSAAGSGPTVSNTATSAALSGVANVTTGTSTITGTLFTETWPTSSSFTYAGTCTVTSVGANSFTAFTVATTYGSSHRVLTVTATSAATASTAYQFAYSCK